MSVSPFRNPGDLPTCQSRAPNLRVPCGDWRDKLRMSWSPSVSASEKQPHRRSSAAFPPRPILTPPTKSAWAPYTQHGSLYWLICSSEIRLAEHSGPLLSILADNLPIWKRCSSRPGNLCYRSRAPPQECPAIASGFDSRRLALRPLLSVHLPECLKHVRRGLMLHATCRSPWPPAALAQLDSRPSGTVHDVHQPLEHRGRITVQVFQE